MEEVLDRTRCVFGKEMEMEMYRGVVGTREAPVERDSTFLIGKSSLLSTISLSCVVLLCNKERVLFDDIYML